MPTSRATVRILVCLALAWVIAAAVSSCNSSSAGGLAQGCSLNSDCNAPLACVFSRCHEACHVSSDCPSGERCVLGGSGSEGSTQNVCQLPVESTCAMSAVCPGTQVCAADQQCRTPCQVTQGCGGGELCLTKASMSLCYAPTNPADNAVLVDAGAIGSDGGILGGDGGSQGDAAGDSTTNPGSDASGDSSSQPTDAAGDSPSGPLCGDAMVLPNGSCGHCLAGACAHGTCVNGTQDYSCQCYAGYTGTGTKTCTVINSCLANNSCTPEYPCQPTASPGQACLGQFAEWPMSDWAAVAGGATQLPSFATDTTAGTVTDQVSGLVWQLSVPVGGCSAPDAGSEAAATCSETDALAYCAALNLAGHNDWRLPTKIELETLLDYSHAQPPYIANAFLPTQSTSYWTASTLERALPYNWFVDFSVANLSSYYAVATTSAGSVRCVRATGIGPTTAAVHYTIQPGAIDAGVGDAAVTGDTVVDNWTGLIWERSMPSQMTAANAQSFCAQLGSGFRIPTIKELLTLVDPILFSPAIDQATFPGTPADWFWSSTANVPANGNYYCAHFQDGLTNSNCGATASYYVRCVH